MSLHAWRSNLGLVAQTAAGAIAGTREGLVSSYDPDNFAVKVRIQPENVETGWMPIKVLQAGNGWGIYAAPNIGDTALVQFLEGDALVPRCVGFLPNDEDRPPSVPAGETWLVHQAGAFIKLLTDGTIASKGTWNHDGDLNVTQTVTATTDVIGGGKHLKTHTHSDPQGGNTGAPN